MAYLFDIPCRIHACLISMGELPYRRKGGLGFGLESPRVQVLVDLARGTRSSVADHRAMRLDESEQRRIEDVLDEIAAARGFDRAVDVSVLSGPGAHTGLGTGTAIRLAAVEGLFLLHDVAASPDEVVEASRRGGTSGIGVHTYFGGGVVLDLGHRKAASRWLPSSAEERATRRRPPVLFQGGSASFGLGVCIPRRLRSLSGREEVDFFELICPVSDSSAARVAYDAVFGFVAGILDGDVDSIVESLESIQRSEFKAAEWAIHGKAFEDLRARLISAGASVVGLSSMGPALYFVARDPEDVAMTVGSDDDFDIEVTRICHSGRRVTTTDVQQKRHESER